MLIFLLCFLWPTLGLTGIGILHQVPDSNFYDQITFQDVTLGAIGGGAVFLISLYKCSSQYNGVVIYKRKF